MSLSQGRRLLAQVGGALAAAVLIGGCGNNYRPVVTPVSTSGPAAQPQSYVVAVSSTGPSTDGVATIIDYSGDSVMAEAPIGVGPLAFTVDASSANGYTFNSDHTMTNFPVSTNLQQKLETVLTVPAGAQPLNILAIQSGLWIGDLNGDVVDIFQGSPEKFTVPVPMAPATSPTFIAGAPSAAGQREYVINQNIAAPTGMECNTTPTAEPNGTATPVETTSLTTDPAIALDPFAAATGSTLARCPVFAVQSTDERRLFVLNRGSDTISVINSQNNTLDECAPFINQNNQPVTCHPILPLSLTAVSALAAASAAPGAPTGIPITPPNGTAGMGAVAGPVYAEYNAATQQLVVANYDGGTISIIDVSLDQYGNDSPTFGTTYTVPVGITAHPDPASVTVLYDGSRAYTANQGDDSGSGNGTVTVVNLSSHSVEKTLAVTGHPRTVVSTQNSLYGKVYVASPDTPYLTILETQNDLEDTTILLQGNIVDVRATTQNGSSQTVTTYNGSANMSNINYSSRIPGYGQPCNLPGIPTPTGSQTLLQACQTIP